MCWPESLPDRFKSPYHLFWVGEHRGTAGWRLNCEKNSLEMFAFSVTTGLLHEGQSLEGEIQGPKNLEKPFIRISFKGWSGIFIWISRDRVTYIGMNSTLRDSKEHHLKIKKQQVFPQSCPPLSQMLGWWRGWNLNINWTAIQGLWKRVSVRK